MATSLMSALALALGLVLALSGPLLAADSDGDGLRDGFERRLSLTAPDDRDSDGDGVFDDVEDEVAIANAQIHIEREQTKQLQNTQR